MAILRTNGFVQLRRGLVEHLIDELITPSEFMVYVVLIIHADPMTGVWRGCAETIAKTCGLPPRTCRFIFHQLENKQYLRRFVTKGKKGIYPVLINRFECTDGAMRGKRLNAFKSTSPGSLVFDDCHDVAVILPGSCRDVATTLPVYREEENKRIEKKKQKPSRAEHAVDLRHKPFRDALQVYWKHKNPANETMPWEGRDGKALADLLSASPDLLIEQFQEFLRNRAKSTVTHGDRVYLWIAKVHSYSEPLNEYGKPMGASNGNGKHTTSAERHVEGLQRAFDIASLNPEPADNGSLRKPSFDPGTEHQRGTVARVSPVAQQLARRALPSGAQ